jgi:hypothetical protein
VNCRDTGLVRTRRQRVELMEVEMKLWTTCGEYSGTGEGHFIAAWIGYAEDEAGARASYEKIFGTFEMAFSREGVWRNGVTGALFPEAQLDRFKQLEGVAKVEAYARQYVNAG